MSAIFDDEKSQNNNEGVFSLYSVPSMNTYNGQAPLSNDFTRMADGIDDSALHDDDDEEDVYQCATQLDDHVISKRILGDKDNDNDEKYDVPISEDMNNTLSASSGQHSASYMGTLNVDMLTAPPSIYHPQSTYQVVSPSPIPSKLCNATLNTTPSSQARRVAHSPVQ